MITKSSVVEIQNLVINPKSRPISLIPEQFLFKYVFSKSQFDKFFKIKEKLYFDIIFAQRKFFLKTLAKYNCSGPAPKIQSRLGWPSNQKLFHHYQHAKIIQSICSIHQIICEIHLI